MDYYTLLDSIDAATQASGKIKLCVAKRPYVPPLGPSSVANVTTFQPSNDVKLSMMLVK